ncbi:hypothetical protein F889_02934, partial [Acinetobacter colistiniresistens]
ERIRKQQDEEEERKAKAFKNMIRNQKKEED